MATLYVNEYLSTSFVGTIPMMVPPGRAIARQNVSISGSSTASNPFSSQPPTGLIMVETDAICSIAIGPPGTVANASYERMAANEVRFYAVVPGDVIAVISNS